MDLETKRQLIHIVGAVFPFYIIAAGHYASIGTFAFLLCAGLIISYSYKRGVRFPIVSKIVDSTERKEVIDEFPGRGALSFFFGSLLVLLIFGSMIKIVCASIIILALGDSFSTLTGKRFGRHKISYNPHKSVEGSIGGFLPAFIGAMVFVSPEIALLGAFTGMVVESLPLRIDDNITIPVVSGFFMCLL